MKFFLCLVLLTVNFSYGQKAVIHNISDTNKRTKEVYIFPDISVSASKAVSRKINNTLRSEILRLDSNYTGKHIFSDVWSTDEHEATLSDISYEIIQNENAILSLSITAEGCGAYCEYFTSYFNFNLNTGNKVTIDSVFTGKGLAVLSDSLNFFRAHKINTTIASAQESLKNKEVQQDSASKESFTDIIEMYEDCLETKFDKNDIPFAEMVINKDQIIIYSDRCSVHYNRNLDEIGTFEYVSNISKWKTYLTPYGKTLIQEF